MFVSRLVILDGSVATPLSPTLRDKPDEDALTAPSDCSPVGRGGFFLLGM